MKDFPKNAKKVFEGDIFDVYQWQQEMFDGSFVTFEKLDRDNTAEVIATTPEGRILIQRQIQPHHDDWFLCVIGGRIEKGEDPLVGAKRETLEETGYTSDDWSLIDVSNFTSKIDWKLYVYAARNCRKVQEQQLDAGEKIEVSEVSFDKFIDLVESGEMKRIAPALKERCIRAKYHEPSKESFKKEIYGGS